MEYRRLGSSEVEVSVVTFGAWAIGGWLWGGQDEKDAVAAVAKAIDLGMTSIDTAPVYGFGQSERIVGKALAGVQRDKVQILTKYGLRWDRGEGEVRFETQDVDGNRLQVRRNARGDSVIEECERSLKLLGTDYIDLYQCHWSDPTTPIAETAEAIGKLLKAGKIRAAGVSNYSVEEMDAAHRLVPLASAQPPYSMINRQIEQDVLPYCREHNIGVLAYSPLQRGLLTGKVTMETTYPPNDHRSENAFFAPANRRRVLDFLEQIRPIADGHGVTLAQLAINWTIHQPGITAALVGARNTAQVEENAKAAQFKLTTDEIRQIDSLLEEVKLDA